MKINHSVIILSVIGGFLIWIIWLVVTEPTNAGAPVPQDGYHQA
jgi:hypothetical protein